MRWRIFGAHADSPKAADLFARDDDVQRVDHSHRPHDCQDRQSQPAKAEQPEDQVQPKRTGLNAHLGGHSQRRQKKRQEDAQKIGEHDLEKVLLLL